MKIRGGALVGALTVLALGVLSCASVAPERAYVAAHAGHSARGASTPLRFAVVSDRTGGHRPGVFDMAVTKLNVLAPDFVMSVGDFIEGYTTDTAELDRQWDEFTDIVAALDPELYYVPGNHDLSNQESRELWKERFGATYGAFVRDECLFLCLNSEDPTSGHIGAEQLETMRRALRRNPQVRWTFVFMHEPLWTYAKDTGWNTMEAILGDRPRTVFAGHMHQYRREVRNGFEYITLGSTGGGGPMRGVNYGEVDHVAWVTVGEGPPRIANLELDGIWDTSLYTDALKASFTPAVSNLPVLVEPVLLESEQFRSAETHVRVTNPTSFPLNVSAHMDAGNSALSISPEYLDLVVPPGETSTRAVTLSSSSPLPSESVPALAFIWQAAYEVPARPPITTRGTAKAFVLPSELHYASPRLPENGGGAEIIAALHEAGHGDLAIAAVGVYAPYTRTTEDALALIRAARAIGISDDLGSRLGFIGDWRVGEPIAWKFGDGLRSALPANETVWHSYHGNPDTAIVDLLKAVGDRQGSSVLAATTLVVNEAGDAVAHLRSDDGIALWINGERVHANNVTRGVATAEDHVPVRLRQGQNEIVVEITQGIEGWAFSVRMARPDGTPYPFTSK